MQETPNSNDQTTQLIHLGLLGVALLMLIIGAIFLAEGLTNGAIGGRELTEFDRGQKVGQGIVPSLIGLVAGIFAIRGLRKKKSKDQAENELNK
ncbi:MAG: hypothetical protein RLZZ519_697 [Bacteroidota bacterium]|jgi:hypothetical protein